MGTRRQEYVEFHSPGTLFAETSRRKLLSRNLPEAVTLSNTIRERHAAVPYAFQFVTCLVADPISDGEGGELPVQDKEISRSGMFFLGGKILRYDEIQDMTATNILRSNMKGNQWPIVVENNNSWRSIQPFTEADVIVDEAGEVTERGDNRELLTYRRNMITNWQKERA